MTSKLYAFDTEDDGAGNFLQGGVYDGERFHHFERREDMGVFMASTRGRFYTFNLEYDLVSLFWPDLAVVRFYRSKGRILSARVGLASFFDLVWAMGGVGMRFSAGLLGLEKGQTDARSRAYLESDLVNTWAVLERLRRELVELGGGPPAGTLAGASLRVFKAMGGEVATFPAPLESVVRSAYYGGRTECFDFAERTVNGYDVNSMFPAAMLADDFPAGNYRPTRSVDAADFVCAEIIIPPCHVPPLPLHRERLLFPVGNFRGVWAGEEIRNAIDHGVVIVKLLHAWKASRRVRPFDLFCSHLFERRAQDPFSNYYCKRIMNSLYGKMAQQGELEYVVGPMDSPVVRLLSLPARDYNVAWPAIITARARVHLFHLLRQAGAGLVYCDTDSVFVRTSHANPFHVSGEIGGLKLEHENARMVVLAPKLYRLKENGKTYYRSRGVPEIAMRNGETLSPAKDFFELGTAQYPRPTRLYEAIRRRMQPGVWSEITKSFGADGFQKRERLEDGATRPLKF